MNAKVGRPRPHLAREPGRPAVGVVDYGMGNRRSVEKALEHVGAKVVVSSEPATLARCAGLVVPGVGAFPRAMENLAALGLDDFLLEQVGDGIPTWASVSVFRLLWIARTSAAAQRVWGSSPGDVRALSRRA